MAGRPRSRSTSWCWTWLSATLLRSACHWRTLGARRVRAGFVTSFAYDLTGKRVWVAGHRGMVGSAIVRRLASESPSEILVASSSDVDLRDQAATNAFVSDARPEVAFVAAAKVGGIEANRTAQGEFLYDNLMISANVDRSRPPSGGRAHRRAWARHASIRAMQLSRWPKAPFSLVHSNRPTRGMR